LITGQKPALRRAHKSISNFKLRKGMPVGLMVTLRGERMFDFVERLIGVVLPRIRDFRGISKRSFDGRGNYSLGIHDQSVFPEINPDEAVKNRGLEITFVTTAQTNEAGEKLLSAFGFPFKK
ncbi:50S ribosomal protein L5, partial [Candidatus Peregrinibacteria bacterium CG08_land_8_20_14_0_20_41_10]